MPTEINIVLVRPIYPRNIGMCARAIANMGASKLILIAPQCELSEEAHQGAACAQSILAMTKIYSSLENFYAHEGEGLRIAFSTRKSKIRQSENWQIQLQKLKIEFSEQVLPSNIYLFFGSEDDGLTAEEIKLAFKQFVNLDKQLLVTVGQP